MAGIRPFLRRQDAHSAYLMLAALLLSLTLVADLAFHRTMGNRWFVWVLLVLCLSGSFATLLLGRRVPRWVGTAAVFLFMIAQVYFLGLANDSASVIASVQQLPVVAFYLGWFVRPRFAMTLVAVSLVSFGAVMLRNPLFSADGAIGVPVAVHALLVMLFCYASGTYLWRRQVRIASTDPLTGAQNRTGLTDRLEYQLRKRAFSRAPLSVVAVDFDNFKQLNDTRGHAAGDLVLSRTVTAWKDAIRSGDSVTRLGGDEFAFILPRATAREAQVIVDRLREVSEQPWSWGIAQALPGESADELLARADAKLFAWKRVRRARDERRARDGRPPGRESGSP
ncbi:GGDEF domain-containing protein [Leucobacter sp. PH1c]|uniref:GGDEF domain-containing protein n=1 Tax=Leucobacter sp. PH1c TaxID=1397278 RepID=UPI0004A7BAF9|nr:GGDEF domain-containing protein [Leucobacter sp. PH1c]